MAIGTNIRLKDKLIKKTDDEKNNVTVVNNVNKINKATFNTKRTTFYVKTELLEKVYNFAYWDRHNITEAINIVIEDGLKGKTTKKRAK